MTEKLFNSPELARLYKKGELDKVLNIYKHRINKKTLVGSGGDASVFRCDDDQCVLKLCTKQIRYFKHFSKRGRASKFMVHINRLDPFFVPVEEILYEDKNVFIYKQKRCTIITSKDIDKQVVIDVFRLVQFMLNNNILLTDLAPHNLGLVNGQVKVFDYHGLHRLKKKGVIKRTYWWKRIVRNLTRFVCGFYIPHKRTEYAGLMQNCNRSTIKKMGRDPSIPYSFIELIKYLESRRDKVSLDKTVDLLEACISQIKASETPRHLRNRRQKQTQVKKVQKDKKDSKDKKDRKARDDSDDSDDSDDNRSNHDSSDETENDSDSSVDSLSESSSESSDESSDESDENRSRHKKRSF